MEVTGVIENVSFKEGTGKFGPWTKASVCINGEWYGAFKNDKNEAMIDRLAKGDEVIVTYEKKGEYNNFTAIEVISKAAVPAPQAASGASGGEKAVNYNQYRQSQAGGRNGAVALVAAALAHDSQFTFEDKENRILSLPKAQNKRLDALVALVETIGHKFAEQNWTAVPDDVVEEEEGYEE